MSLDGSESQSESRRRRLQHFRNNWGTDLQNIDGDDSTDDILEHNSRRSPLSSPLGSRRSSTGSISSIGNLSPMRSSPPPYLINPRLDANPRVQWMRHSHELQSNMMSKCQIETTCGCPVQRDKYNCLKCNCGESDSNMCEWVWDETHNSPYVRVINENRDVCFFSEYSSGTAAVKGNKSLVNDIFYWEIKMISPVYGTDMMIGICTETIDVKDRKVFCSLLGEDTESWGLSYTGLFHWNGQSKFYSPRLNQGCIIGVSLDLWHGTLSFNRNREPLGPAAIGLRGKSLYPVVSSTAARSGMRILQSRSFKANLQYLCCLTLRKTIEPHHHVLDVVSLPPGLSAFLKSNLNWILSPLTVTRAENKRKGNGVQLESHDKRVKQDAV